MKKMLIPVVAGATLICLGAFAPGKDKSFEGKIVYEIVYDEVPEMIEPYIAMLPKENTSYVKGSMVRAESGAMGVSTVIVFDAKKNEGFMMIEGMGMEKTAYTMSAEDMKKAEKDVEKPVVIKSTEKKKISGYDCVKEMYYYPSQPNDTLVAYVTSEITGKNQQMSFLSGFPLQYQGRANGISTTVTVKEITKQKVNDSFFKVPDGVPTKPYSELAKMAQPDEEEEGDE